MALQELTVCWKKIGHYNMRCCWFPPAPKDKLDLVSLQEGPDTQSCSRALHQNHSVATKVDREETRDGCAVKFEVQVCMCKVMSACKTLPTFVLRLRAFFNGILQLFKTKENKYLLDLQKVGGSHFLFLDLCASFLAQLRLL